MLDALIDDMAQHLQARQAHAPAACTKALVLIIGSQGGNQRLSEHP